MIKKICGFTCAMAVFALLSISIAYAQSADSSLRSLSGGLASGDTAVTMKSSVFYDKTTDTYIYEYQIKNVGSKFFLFQWGTLDRVLSGHYNFPHIFEMKPGKEYKFSLKSKEVPVVVSTRASLFRKDKKAGQDKMLADSGATASGYDYWFLSPGSDMPGYLPPSFLKQLDEK